MKVQIKGWIHGTYYSFHKDGKEPYCLGFTQSEGRPVDTEYSIHLCPHVIEADVPKIDPVPAIVEALQEQKKSIYAKAAQEVAEVDDRIQKYLALTNEVQS